MLKESQIEIKKSFGLRILNFYIFSNIHVAFATFCLTKITLLEIGISESKTAWFVFFTTIISYNLIRFIRFGDIESWYQKWFKSNEYILYGLTFVAIVFSFFLVFDIRFKSWLVLLPFGFCTIFYVIPLYKFSLRDIPYLKLFLIAISWAGITVLFPLVQNYMTIRSVDYITFLQRFLFVFIITIPFDIRDLTVDSKKIKTLPQQLGIKKSKIVGIVLILIFFLLEFFKSTNSIILIAIVSIVSFLLLIKSTQNQSKYYSAFFVEFIPILWFLLFLLLE